MTVIPGSDGPEATARAWFRSRIDAGISEADLDPTQPEGLPTRAANRLGLVRYWQATRTWPDFCADKASPIDCPALAARASGTLVARR